MIGVDYDVFWGLDPKTLEPFTKAFRLKMELQDSTNYQLGAYVRLAILSSMEKKVKYPKAPIFTERKKNSNTMTAEEIRNKMMQTMKTMNRRLKRGG